MKRRDFEEVYSSGKRETSKHFILISLKSPTLPPQSDSKNYGIVVSKKNGSAVCRNKIRRRIKEILLKVVPDNNVVFVVIPRHKNVATIDFLELKQDLFFLLKKAKIVSQDNLVFDKNI